MRSIKYYMHKYEKEIVKNRNDYFFVYQMVHEMFVEMHNDIIKDCEALPKNERTKNNFYALIRKANTRWNGIDRKFKRKYRFSPLKVDAINLFWMNRLESFKVYLADKHDYADVI